jgi:hypothetical protein
MGFEGWGKTPQACHSDPAMREKNVGGYKISELRRFLVIRQ